MAEVIKAERATIKILEGISLHLYRMPDGETRISTGSASLAIGLSVNWISRLIKRKDVAFEILQRTGFVGELKMVAGKNTRPVGTISCSDFVKASLFAQKQRKNFNSQKILEALVSDSLNSMV
jgi:hypothetical protein